ncbi:MAG: hypothetical protein Q9165_007185 [Trypethelium subeluteriae]
MAEAVAALGLVGSIVQLIDFSAKISTRLKEFQSSFTENLNVFGDLYFQLPLLSDTLAQLCTPVVLSRLSEQNKQALVLTVRRCTRQVEFLDILLKRTLPKGGESSFSKRWKALCSLAREKEVKRAVETLSHTSNFLVLHQSAYNSAMVTQMYDRIVATESSNQMQEMTATSSGDHVDPSGQSTIFYTSFNVGLYPFNILSIIKFHFCLAWGDSGYSMAVTLRPVRVIKYTSPGFIVLEKCKLGFLEFPEAQRQLQELFEYGQASPDDVDPDGRTWLEVKQGKSTSLSTFF